MIQELRFRIARLLGRAPDVAQAIDRCKPENGARRVAVAMFGSDAASGEWLIRLAQAQMEDANRRALREHRAHLEQHARFQADYNSAYAEAKLKFHGISNETLAAIKACGEGHE